MINMERKKSQSKEKIDRIKIIKIQSHIRKNIAKKKYYKLKEKIMNKLDGSFFEIISNGNSLVRNNSSNSIFTYDSMVKENSLKFKKINNK